MTLRLLIFLPVSLLFFAFPAWAANLDYSEIEKQISVNRGLNVLPDSVYKNFTLFFNSLSVMDASPTAPRVILFDDEGKTLVAFTSAHHALGGNEIEILEWDDSKKTYFPKLVSMVNGKLKVDHQPKNCKDCHFSDGEGLSPILADYRFWPGAVGAADDRVLVKKVHPEEIDVAEFHKMIQSMRRDPRYHRLLKQHDVSANYWTAPDSDTDPADRTFQKMPNTRLTLALMHRRVETFLHKGRQQTGFAKHSLEYIRAMICRTPLSDDTMDRNAFVALMQNFKIQPRGMQLDYFYRRDEVDDGHKIEDFRNYTSGIETFERMVLMALLAEHTGLKPTRGTDPGYEDLFVGVNPELLANSEYSWNLDDATVRGAICQRVEGLLKSSMPATPEAGTPSNEPHPPRAQ